jgi:hypothetical protein
MNKNTRLARKMGFCSLYDMQNNGNKIFKGLCCDTAWNNSKSNKTSKKVYKKQNND